MNNKKIVSIIIAVAIIIGGGSFYAGMQYGRGSAQGGASGASRFAGGAGGVRAGRNGGGFASGTVVNKDSSSITVELRGAANGASSGSVIVFYSGNTAVLKSAVGTPDDLSVGDAVTVIGTPNSDGSVTAQSIQIRPAGMAQDGAGRTRVSGSSGSSPAGN